MALAQDDTIARLDGLTDVSAAPSVDGSLLGYVASAGTWQVVAHITVPSGLFTSDNAVHVGGIVFHAGGVVSEGTGTPGNARGTNATDLQSTRASATQVASGTNSTVTGGINNTAAGSQSVAGGNSNQANGTNSAAPFGANAIASLFGQFSHAAGQFATGGDAQTSVLVAFKSTTDGSATEMFLNGTSSRLTLAANRGFIYRIMVIARENTSNTGNVAAWTSVGVLLRGTGNVAISGNTDTQLVNAPGYAYSVSADTTNQSLKLNVTGLAGKTVHWVARIELVEVV